MAVLFSSLSALVKGTASAAKGAVTEIVPPAAALVGDIVATAWASVAWFIYYLWAVVAAAVAVAIDTTMPYAVPVAKTAAWSVVQASRLFVGVALQLLSYLWSFSSAAVAGAARLATAMLPAAVTLVESVVGAALASVAWVLCHLWSLLATAAVLAIHALSCAVAAAESAARASQPWLELASSLVRELYGWLLAAAAHEPPDMAQAVKNAVESAVRAAQPWLDMASRTSCMDSMGGWTRWQSRSSRTCPKRSRT